MHLHVVTTFFLVFEQVTKIFTQGIPVSPCPKIFQYRYDGLEWLGILSVRNTDFGEALHIKVTLSIRGKPPTNYLGDIELLTRGQFHSDTPLMYKVRFPKSPFPPKLLQIAANKHVICIGGADHSIFVTHIHLEHTRKFTFIPQDAPISAISDFTTPLPLPLPLSPPPPLTAPSFSDEHLKGDLSFFDNNPAGINTKHLPPTNGRGLKEICGRIDDRVRIKALQSTQLQRNGNTEQVQGKTSHPKLGKFTARLNESLPLITTSEADQSDDSDDENSMDAVGHVDELPSIARGAWPWLAAIYVNNLTSLTYQCGGTLISSRIVVSSAHCFQMFKKRYSANEVLVFLGRHNLRSWNEEGSMAAPVDDIFIHPDFDEHLNTYDADIAVIVLKLEVRFSIFIRPACMWTGSTQMQFIEGEHGIVVGWGLGALHFRNSSSPPSAWSPLTTPVPKIIDAPIISNDVCFKANDQYRSLSSNRTFCAGSTAANKVDENKKKHQTQTHIGPCTGDSGAGLMIYNNNRWMLRGTVSASLPNKTNKCNVNQYVIYTDVAKFLDWIFAFII